MSPKVIGKMMRMAKNIAEDNNPCHSRKVGCIIVDKNAKILSTGYNGPPRKTPHCDSKEYIKNILWNKLDDKEKYTLIQKSKDRILNSPKEFADIWGVRTSEIREAVDRTNESSLEELRMFAANGLEDCKSCPRRLLGYGAGIRTDLCSCQHAERNAISNSNGSLDGGILFGYCCISCFQCTGAVINALIKEVHFLEGPEYESGCLKLYEYAKISVFLHKEEEFTC